VRSEAVPAVVADAGDAVAPEPAPIVRPVAVVPAADTATGAPVPVAPAAEGITATLPVHDPVAAIVGGPPRSLPPSGAGEPDDGVPSSNRLAWLYDTRFLVALFATGLAIGGTGAWLLFSQSTAPSPQQGLPGNGVALAGGLLLPLALAVAVVMALGVGLVVGNSRVRAAGLPASQRRPRGWRWIYDSRVLATVAAIALAGYGFSLIAPPGASPDVREIPGEVNNALQSAVAQPETGYPRIKLTRVAIDLLLVKGDGRTPPVKYEAFTYPGADHLLSGPTTGGSNTYVYAHARNGMFWRLHDLHIGDLVEVDFGSARLIHYRVAEIHPSVNWKDISWLQPTSDDRLTLQTCNGWKDDDPRFVVVARRVPDTTALAR
jgi:LPXTG-site transpeptidase (sortase) family protein